MQPTDLWSDVNPVVLGEGDWDGRVEGELVGREVGELLLLGVDCVQEGVQLGGGQQHAGVVLPHHTLTLHAHLCHLHIIPVFRNRIPIESESGRRIRIQEGENFNVLTCWMFCLGY
jgi:hypothetical protein